jgi:predicted DNA-binding protein
MKVITLRLSDEEYELIAGAAKAEYRPISNYITAAIIKILGEEAEDYKVKEEAAAYGNTQVNIKGGKDIISKRNLGKIVVPRKRSAMRGLLGKAKGIIPKGKSSTEYVRELRSTLYGKIK